RAARASARVSSASSAWRGTRSQAPTPTISARSARGRSWRASTTDTHGWRAWSEASRRRPARCMSDGPATTTSHGPLASRASARVTSGQALTTATGSVAWWRMRAASSPLRSTTRIRAAGPPSPAGTSADQPQGVAVDREVGDVPAAEAQSEGGQDRVEEAVVDGRQDRVDQGQHGAQHAAETQPQAEDVEAEIERLALDQVAQPQRRGAHGLGVRPAERSVEREVARRAGQADVGPGGDAGHQR